MFAKVVYNVGNLGTSNFNLLDMDSEPVQSGINYYHKNDNMNNFSIVDTDPNSIVRTELSDNDDNAISLEIYKKQPEVYEVYYDAKIVTHIDILDRI